MKCSIPITMLALLLVAAALSPQITDAAFSADSPSVLHEVHTPFTSPVALFHSDSISDHASLAGHFITSDVAESLPTTEFTLVPEGDAAGTDVAHQHSKTPSAPVEDIISHAVESQHTKVIQKLKSNDILPRQRNKIVHHNAKNNDTLPEQHTDMPSINAVDTVSGVLPRQRNKLVHHNTKSNSTLPLQQSKVADNAKSSEILPRQRNKLVHHNAKNNSSLSGQPEKVDHSEENSGLVARQRNKISTLR